MAILKLAPVFKSAIWGGNKLNGKFGFKSEGDNIAEAWTLCAHKNGENIVCEGDFAGESFTAALAKLNNPLGENCKSGEKFPILIKLIDAKSDLSIQVHPNDEYALKNENQFGKTEMWYIVENEPNSGIFHGMKQPVSKQEFIDSIENNSLTELLNFEKTEKGKAYFIESGTIHAICGGNIILEIQQNSDVTYRIFDYNRRDKNGNARELHKKQAMDVCTLDKPKKHNFGSHLAKCELFTVDKLNISGEKTLCCSKKSFHSITVLSGSGEIECCNKNLSLKAGDSVFISANSGNYTIKGCLETVITYI